jgi:hypothetical protein
MPNIRRARPIFLIFLSAAIGGAAFSSPAATQKQYYAHPAVEDRFGVIAPWHRGLNGPLDERIRIAAEIYKRYPWAGLDKAVMAAPHIVYNTHWSIAPDGTITIPPTDPWMCGDLGQRALSIIQGLTRHYAYSGDPLAFVYVPLACDYILDYGLTAPDDAWPGFPISTPTKGIGYGKAAADVPNQLDLCALMGVEMLRAYRLTGTARYAEAARHWGDVFADKCNFSDRRLPPWGRYANPQYMAWSDQLTGTTALIAEFLDDLIRLGHNGRDRMIVKARDAAQAYLIEKMLPRWTENEIWGRHYWDWEAAVMTGGVPWVCEYFLDHPDAFPNWKIDVRNILSLIFSRNGVDPVSKGDMYSGAWAFPESSSCCGTSLSYNQYTYGPAFLRYGVLADDERMREIGRRMMIMAAYDSTATGYVLDGLAGEVVAAKDWLNLAQPWPLCQAFKAIAAWPEVFGANRENHIVSSSSVVNLVMYQKGRISYSTFDAPENTIDTLRLSFAPLAVTSGGRPLVKRGDLKAEGFTVKPLANGDCIVRIRHDGFREISVQGEDPQTAVEARRVLSARGERMDFSFRGNQVRLMGDAGPEGGLADVYLDGAKQLTLIDGYAPTPRPGQLLYARSGLAGGRHELRIVALGAGNPISKGARIAVTELQSSNAAGAAGVGEGGGPRGPQRMIFGYTDREDYVDAGGSAWRPGTEFIIRAGTDADSVVKALYTGRRSLYIGGTSDPEIYRYGVHGGEFWINLTVGPGKYDVRLLMADTNTHAKMDVWINGREAARELDVAKEAGGLFRALDRVFPGIEAKNGAIEIRFKGCGDKEAAVQAVEIVPSPHSSAERNP